jgi:hypothetical protein
MIATDDLCLHALLFFGALPSVIVADDDCHCMIAAGRLPRIDRR